MDPPKDSSSSAAVLVVVEKAPVSCPLYDVAVGSHQVPIIYSPEYNITLFGLERLHPFDAGKWGKVVQLLKEQKLLIDASLVQPREASKSELLKVHKQRYLTSLKWSVNVAKITEVTGAALLPNCLLQRKLLRPFRYQTGGSVLAARLAVERGWSINVGGGFHHCSSGRGGGFCAYADITLTVTLALEHYEHINRVLIVDLDAHQGNGHERDFMGCQNVYIMDVYNRLIYPRDEHAKEAISKRVELSPYTEDRRYLDKVEEALTQTLEEFDADLVVYNAGTDILEDDPLGLLSVTKQGVIRRDELVWRMVRERDVPLIMLTSGGYQRCSAAVIADSIANLHRTGLIDLKPATVVTAPRHQHHPTAAVTTAAAGAVTDCGSGLTTPDDGGGSNKKQLSTPSSSPPSKYTAFLSRCGGGGRKKSSAVSASESSTPLSGRYSVTDSTTSSPPPHAQQLQDQQQQQGLPVKQHRSEAELPAAGAAVSAAVNGNKINGESLMGGGDSTPDKSTSSHALPRPSSSSLSSPQQPPSFIDIRPNSSVRHSIVSPDSMGGYATPRSTIQPMMPAITSPGTPCSPASLHPTMTQQPSLNDSITPPSPAYRSVAGSINTVHTINSPHTDTSGNTPPPPHLSEEGQDTPPPHHKSLESTLSHHTAGSITTPPSHYESADSINLSGSLVCNNAFIPP